MIEDDVEIGANATIDRPAVGETRIGAGTKIDNLVQIAHGVTIGRDVLLAAQVGIAGSTTIEDRVTLAGQVGVAGPPHARQGRRSPRRRPASRTRSTPGAFVSGYPAIDNRDWLKASAVFRRLPELRKTRRRPQKRARGDRSAPEASSVAVRAIIEAACHNRSLMPVMRRCAALTRARCWRVLALCADHARRASRPPRLDYTMTTLPNGLNVVFLEDHSTPIVHLQIWYHVGSKNERPGRTGFAHLFEHMMFKGSKNVEPEGHPSYISSVGGQSNAYTNEDATVFWETVPAQYLPLVLWLEADRMASLRIDEKAFKTEREVVKEERRMRIENQPYGRLQEIIYDQAFTVHPYKHPVIGSMKDLDAASIDDVRDFFQTYYVPNNATAVLVGDFDSKEALALVTQYLGRVPKSDKPVPRDIPKEPPQTKERRVTLTETWPLPAVVVAHHITFDGNPDSYPLHIASKILSDGQSSRIYRKLVYEKRHRARGVRRRQHHRGSEPVLRGRDRPAGAHAGGGDDGADRRARSGCATSRSRPRSCSRRRTSSRATTSSGASPNKNKAEQLGHAVVIHNDIKTADGEFDIFQNITAADVQRVAKTYFTPENRLVMTIMPKGGDAAERLAMTRARRACSLRLAVACAVSARAQTQNWPSERPPRPLAGARRQVSALRIQDAAERPAGDRGVAPRAAGGQPAADRPRRRGAGSGRPARRGRARGPLLDQGTTTKSAEQIANAIDSIGGAIGTGAGTD